MSSTFDEAMQRLDAVLSQVERGLTRRLELERSSTDLETELQILQDDRAQLAASLDGATARLTKAEHVAQDVGKRVQGAITTIRGLMGKEDASHHIST